MQNSTLLHLEDWHTRAGAAQWLAVGVSGPNPPSARHSLWSFGQAVLSASVFPSAIWK